jgi:hypothetical protein
VGGYYDAKHVFERQVSTASSPGTMLATSRSRRVRELQAKSRDRFRRKPIGRRGVAQSPKKVVTSWSFPDSEGRHRWQATHSGDKIRAFPGQGNLRGNTIGWRRQAAPWMFVFNEPSPSWIPGRKR